jgi:hypothetical protein
MARNSKEDCVAELQLRTPAQFYVRWLWDMKIAPQVEK